MACNSKFDASDISFYEMINVLKIDCNCAFDIIDLASQKSIGANEFTDLNCDTNITIPNISSIGTAFQNINHRKNRIDCTHSYSTTHALNRQRRNVIHRQIASKLQLLTKLNLRNLFGRWRNSNFELSLSHLILIRHHLRNLYLVKCDDQIEKKNVWFEREIRNQNFGTILWPLQDLANKLLPEIDDSFRVGGATTLLMGSFKLIIYGIC